MSQPGPAVSVPAESSGGPPTGPIGPSMGPTGPVGGGVPAPLRTVLDVALRIVGGALSVLGAVLTAVLELLLSLVRVGGVLIGISVLVAVVANVGLSWFACRTVGSRWAFALPAVVWFALMVIAAGGTDEGDVLIAANNWVGLAMIFAGSIAFGVMGFRMILASGPPRPARHN